MQMVLFPKSKGRHTANYLLLSIMRSLLVVLRAIKCLITQTAYCEHAHKFAFGSESYNWLRSKL